MTLREMLGIYKDSRKIHLEAYVDEKVCVKIALYQNVDTIPDKYLNSEVIKWSYKLSIVDMERISIVPIASIKIV